VEQREKGGKVGELKEIVKNNLGKKSTDGFFPQAPPFCLHRVVRENLGGGGSKRRPGKVRNKNKPNVFPSHEMRGLEERSVHWNSHGVRNVQKERNADS